eukprot:TRINITY_DN7592_c0_g1_i4.p1 TRINITY_DN7592_c0_g1~~TRINITY_DN7592_c0_g1_i4.p1  ORF type:complete len:1248 (+),score=293.70 TRINITY_DN7592_c0_g1_i4:101-3844(+)
MEDPGTTFLIEAIRANDIMAVRQVIWLNPSLVDKQDMEGIPPLSLAAYFGLTDIVRELLAQGSQVNVRGGRDATPLQVAAQRGHIETIEELLKHGADINLGTEEHGNTPLFLAAGVGLVSTIKVLIARGARIDARGLRGGHTPLLIAAKEGHTAAVKELLNSGADIEETTWDGETALQIATQMGHGATVDLLLSCGAKTESSGIIRDGGLLSQAQRGDTGRVRELLKKGVDIEEASQDGNTALDYAADGGHLATVAELVAQGAKIDARNKSGYTPLLSATINKQHEVCSFLLSHGCNTEEHVTGTRHTALHLAALIGDHITLRVLLSHGLATDSHALNGATPLVMAAGQGHLSCVISLLQAGATVNLPREDGCRPIYLAAQNNRAAVVRALLDYGSSIDETILDRENTPLMGAALASSDETVSALLSWGADPNTAPDKITALMMAVKAKCVSTISILAPVTEVCLNMALATLASYGQGQVELTPEIHQLLERTAEDENVATAGLIVAARYGTIDILNILLKTLQSQSSSTLKLDTRIQTMLLNEAVMSDNPEVCKAVLSFTEEVGHEAVLLALERGKADVINMLVPDLKDDLEVDSQKRELKTQIMNKTASLDDTVPKCVEYRYDNELEKLRPLIQSNKIVPFSNLLEALHIKEIHTEKNCPDLCRQQKDCSKMRQVYNLIKRIVAKMGHINPIFQLGKDRHPSIVGSVKEGTRVFFSNELDIHVSLNKQHRQYCEFDVESQSLVVNDAITEKDHLSKFVKGKVFDCNSYFSAFLETLVQAVKEIDLTDGFDIGKTHYDFTMKPLSMNYVPCLRCMSTTDSGRPQARRCRHRTDCPPHQKGEPECQNGCTGTCDLFSHRRTCNCQEFGSPSLTKTKIGAALHINFPDGVVDCDLNVPTIPSSTSYDGSVGKARIYLEDKRPVDWLEESTKLEDMQVAEKSPYMLGQEAWQIKMRLINRDTVLPRQSLLFLNPTTLEGKKGDVYVASKIFKFCTGSSAKSFQCKFAVSTVLGGANSDSLEIGAALREVIHFPTIRGKFGGVHPDLRAEGIVGVEVENEGLHFIRKTSHDLDTIKSTTRASKEAMRAKQLGNAAYSRKDFSGAILLYEKAVGLEPGEMIYWSNLAAVMMETRAYKECVWISRKAAELGLEKGADPGLILKATNRAEKAKLILKQLDEAEKEKQEGNSRYQAGDFHAALEHYSTALRLAQGDPRIFANRAACWHKLKLWKQCLEVSNMPSLITQVNSPGL